MQKKIAIDCSAHDTTKTCFALVSRVTTKTLMHWYCCVSMKGPNSTVCARLCALGLCGAQVRRLAPEVTSGGREVISFAGDGGKCFLHIRDDPNNPS